MKYTNYHIKRIADLYTPLGLCIKLRDRFSKVLLLESSDYSSKEDSQSYLCFDSLNSFILENGNLQVDGYYQAGAGIVISSDEEKELQEVNNKLAALKKALVLAEKL